MKFSLQSRFVLFIVLFLCLGAAGAQAADPVVVELHYQNGVKFYKRGLYDRAIQEFEKTLSLEPGNREAAEYLEKVKSEKGSLTRVEAKKSEASEIRSLYEEGRRLYKQRDYKAAIEIFDKLLLKKPVDDFASFYKEKSEIFISRQLARERKIEEKKRARERARVEREQKKSSIEAKRQARQEMLKGRREINERRSSLKERKVAEALEAEGLAKEGQAGPVGRAAEAAEKRRIKDRDRADRIAEKEERVETARKAKEEKREAELRRREERRALRAEKSGGRNDKRPKEIKIEEAEGTPDVMRNKELFLNGVGQYGRGEFEAAVISFEAVIAAESNGRKLYTNSAKRLLDKARKRSGQD